MDIILLSVGQLVLAISLGFVAFRLFQARGEVRELRALVDARLAVPSPDRSQP